MNAKSWGSGYVTDISYISRFHQIQSQSLMALGPMLNGFKARLIRRDEAFHICDVGCGPGTTTLVMAAANPGWQVTGLDFNPAHIAAARATAAAAAITNVRFIEADLSNFEATPAARGLDDFDAMTMHGVWSWVDGAVQDGILRLINSKLKPGGMFYVSYNLATAWQNAIGLQRLVREAGLRQAGRSDRQAAAGLEAAQALAKADGPLTYRDRTGRMMLENIPGMPAAYLAHEFMNAHWKPLMHGDVAARMAEAKLEFGGSARLMTNFPQLTLSAEQCAVLEKFEGDAAMTELFKDLCQPILLRADIFIRGAERMPQASHDAALGEVYLALTKAPEDWIFEFDAAGGKASMAEDFYRKIFERMVAGPASVAELLALPGLTERSHSPAELIAVVIGTEQARALPNPGAAMDAAATRLNRELMRAQLEAGHSGQPVIFAVPALGGGMQVPFLDGALLHELAAAPDDNDPQQLAARMGARRSAEERAKLAEQIGAFFSRSVPLLGHLGLSA